jgi:hypothetical protein
MVGWLSRLELPWPKPRPLLCFFFLYFFSVLFSRLVFGFDLKTKIHQTCLKQSLKILKQNISVDSLLSVQYFETTFSKKKEHFDKNLDLTHMPIWLTFGLRFIYRLKVHSKIS